MPSPESDHGIDHRNSHDGTGAMNILGGDHTNHTTMRANNPNRTGVPTEDPGEFEINLTYEESFQRHRVAQHMFVTQLAEEAAVIFRLVADDLVLLLFGMAPRTLSGGPRMQGGPNLGQGGYSRAVSQDQKYWATSNFLNSTETLDIGRRGTKHLSVSYLFTNWIS